MVIEASQLYCYAITLLIKGYSLIDVFNIIKREITLPAIREWFENEIEADRSKLSSPNSNDKSNVKIAFTWAFYYLKN